MLSSILLPSFEWEEDKNSENQKKHGVSFEEVQRVFLDPRRLVYEDLDHTTPTEKRYFCIGMIRKKVCTVRFTYRNNNYRIIGAGFWRKGKKKYEEKYKT